MASEILAHDQNAVRVLGGITDDSNQYIKMLRVDPVSGRLLVSATGAGLVEIDFTGTVNGSNKVFTGSQPTYVVSDGIWLKATDSNSNVQWTWAANTLTMTVPPQSSIYGF